jgi:hypothetical protein
MIDSTPAPIPPVRMADTGEPADVAGVLARLAIGRRVLVRGSEADARRLVADAQAEIDRAKAAGGG